MKKKGAKYLENRRKGALPAFLRFPQCFQKAFILIKVKSRECVHVKLLKCDRHLFLFLFDLFQKESFNPYPAVVNIDLFAAGFRSRSACTYVQADLDLNPPANP